MEIHTAEVVTSPFFIAFGLGLILAAGWFATVIGAGVWVRVWAWIDDAKPPKENPMIRLVMRLRGYEEDTEKWSAYKYRKGEKKSDGDFATLLPMAAALVAPSAFLAAFYLYPLTLTVITLYLMARLARFARRHKKLFDKHIADPNAHK